MEEAVVRIILQDAGQAVQGAATTRPTGTPSSRPPQPAALGYTKEIADIRRAVNMIAGVMTGPDRQRPDQLSTVRPVRTAPDNQQYVHPSAPTGLTPPEPSRDYTKLIQDELTETRNRIELSADSIVSAIYTAGSESTTATEGTFESVGDAIVEAIARGPDRKALPSMEEIKQLEGFIEPELLDIVRKKAVEEESDRLRKFAPEQAYKSESQKKFIDALSELIEAAQLSRPLMSQEDKKAVGLLKPQQIEQSTDLLKMRKEYTEGAKSPLTKEEQTLAESLVLRMSPDMSYILEKKGKDQGKEYELDEDIELLLGKKAQVKPSEPPKSIVDELVPDELTPPMIEAENVKITANNVTVTGPTESLQPAVDEDWKLDIPEDAQITTTTEDWQRLIDSMKELVEGSANLPMPPLPETQKKTELYEPPPEPKAIWSTPEPEPPVSQPKTELYTEPPPESEPPPEAGPLPEPEPEPPFQPTEGLSELDALRYGQASPWAPPTEPIQVPEGLADDQAEFLRLQAEAARRGISMPEYIEMEDVMRAAGQAVPPPESEPEPEHELLPDEPIPPDHQEYEPLPTTGSYDEVEPLPDYDVEPPPQWTGQEPLEPPSVPESEDLGEGLELPEEPTKEHPDWQDWKQPHHGRGWNFPKTDDSKPGPGLTLEQLKQMEYFGAIPPPAIDSSGDPVYRVVTTDQYERFLERLRESGEPPPNFAKGGWVGNHPGKPSGTDTEPAWLTPGEYVVPADVAAANRNELEAMTSGATHMALGGIVRGAGKLIGGGARLAGGAISWGYGAGKAVGGAIVDNASTIGSAASVIAHRAADPSADASASTAKLGDTVSKVGEKLATVAPVMGGLVTAVGKVTSAFGSLMQSIDKTADRYAEYSPEIAQAQATAEIRQVMGDLRRAAEVGPEMARYVQAQSDLQQKFEDIKIKVLMAIMPIVTRAAEILEAILPSGQAIEQAIRALLSPLMAIPGVASRIEAIMQRGLDRDLNPPPMDPTALLNLDFESPGWGVHADPGVVPRL